MLGKQKSFLGFDIGAGGVKLVQLRAEKNRPVLYTYGLTTEGYDVHKLSEHQLIDSSQNLNPTEEKQDVDKAALLRRANIDEKKIDEYADKIKKLCAISKTTTNSAVVSLPVSAVFHAIVTLPKTDKKEELNRMVRAEVKKFVPFPLQEMSIDHQVLENADKQAKAQKVLVNAVPSKLINFYAKMFQKAGLELEALEPESAALSRSLIGRDNAVAMLIDMGAERTNFFVIEKSVPIIHQSIDFGGDKVDQIMKTVLGVDNNMIETIKTDVFSYYSKIGHPQLTREKFVEMFMPILDPIIKKIELSFELNSKQMNGATALPEKIVLTGGMAFMPYLTELFAEKFKIKCFVGDPWSRVVYQQSLRPLLQKIGPRMSVAIGLALRNMV